MEQGRDIDLAKEKLLGENYALVIVKQGEFLFTSKEKGIKPIYLALTQLGDTLKGASLADKVIGKAAAMFCQLAKVDSVYADLISDKAIEVLKQTGIDLEYNNTCPYILNQSQDGMCPVEKLATNIDDGKSLLRKVADFLKVSESKQGG
jgi:hypothetical protein